MQYTALIVDIVKSKELSETSRAEAQVFIKKSLAVLNDIFKPALTFDVIFSGGDEVQGLFKYPSAAVMYYRLLRMILSPIDIRGGIGVGEWSVKIIGGTSTEQDGTAYTNAREAISQVHHADGWDILFHANCSKDFYVNTSLNSSLWFSKKQSKAQKEISLLVEYIVPFFDAERMQLEQLSHLSMLLSEKPDSNLFHNIDTVTLASDVNEIFSKDIQRNKIFIKSTIKKGTSTKISSITGTTRQNIDSIMRNGNISLIRNIDLTTLIFIHENY